MYDATKHFIETRALFCELKPKFIEGVEQVDGGTIKKALIMLLFFQEKLEVRDLLADGLLISTIQTTI